MRWSVVLVCILLLAVVAEGDQIIITIIIAIITIIPDICHERHEYVRVNFFWPV